MSSSSSLYKLYLELLQTSKNANNDEDSSTYTDTDFLNQKESSIQNTRSNKSSNSRWKIVLIINLLQEMAVLREDNQKYTFGELKTSNDGQGYLVPGVYYAPEVTLNILSMDLLEKQGFEIKYDGNRCILVYMFNNKGKQKFDEDRMRTMHNKYLEDYFESLTKKDEGMEEDLIRIKGNLYSNKGPNLMKYVEFSHI
ncbi:hypothetical protein Tco_1328986 [Tanacetum coccineum]